MGMGMGMGIGIGIGIGIEEKSNRAVDVDGVVRYQ